MCLECLVFGFCYVAVFVVKLYVSYMVEIGKMNDEKMCVSRHLGELLPCIVNYMNVRIFVFFFSNKESALDY